jgi:hypothetical protein
MHLSLSTILQRGWLLKQLNRRLDFTWQKQVSSAAPQHNPSLSVNECKTPSLNTAALRLYTRLKILICPGRALEICIYIHTQAARIYVQMMLLTKQRAELSDVLQLNYDDLRGKNCLLCLHLQLNLCADRRLASERIACWLINHFYSGLLYAQVDAVQKRRDYKFGC